MSGSSTQQTQQQSTSAPWAPSNQELTNLLSGISGINPAVTGAQTSAGNNLQTSANGLPNYGAPAGSVTSGLLGGDPTGLLTSGNNNLQSILSPIASQSVNPLQNPQIQQLLQTIQQQTTNAVGSQFAGSGRTGSGDETAALALGLSQGEAAPLLNQFNQNQQNIMNAGSQMFGANYNTAGAISGNQQAGLGAAAQQPGIAMAPALAQLQAAQTNYNLPISNLAGISGLTLPIAGLGGQTNSSGSATSTPSFWQDLAMAGQGIGGFSKLFGIGNSPNSGGGANV